jgi:serine/threonine-protein kinase RsbW
MPTEPNFTHEICFNACPEEGLRGQSKLLEKLEEYGYTDDALFAVRLATEEAILNAIKHGNSCDPSKKVWLRFAICDQRVEIEIEDEGPGFDPNRIPDPTLQENILVPGGRGVMLMRAFMHTVDFPPPGNTCRMTRRR